MAKLKIPRQIGQVVKDRRIAMGITQSQLAELSGTSRSLVYRVEKGATNGVAFDKLFDVLKALGLELAVVDAKGSFKGTLKNAADTEGGRSMEALGNRSHPYGTGCKTASKGSSSRNAETRLEEELKAARNIKGFNVMRSSEE